MAKLRDGSTHPLSQMKRVSYFSKILLKSDEKFEKGLYVMLHPVRALARMFPPSERQDYEVMLIIIIKLFWPNEYPSTVTPMRLLCLEADIPLTIRCTRFRATSIRQYDHARFPMCPTRRRCCSCIAYLTPHGKIRPRWENTPHSLNIDGELTLSSLVIRRSLFEPLSTN
jgi:hypothetical protein